MSASSNLKIFLQCRFFVVLLPALLFAGGSSLAANTIKYTYDALGRLTFVNDTLNGNRDYDYDKAGESSVPDMTFRTFA